MLSRVIGFQSSLSTNGVKRAVPPMMQHKLNTAEPGRWSASARCVGAAEQGVATVGGVEWLARGC